MTVSGFLGSALSATLELGVPRLCACCGVLGTRLCAACLDDLAGCLFASGPTWVRPSPCPPGLPPVSAAAAYAGCLAVALRAYKDGARRDLRPLLAVPLARVLGALAPRGGLGVVMPSSARARRSRGDHPVGELARLASLPSGLAVVSPLRLSGRVVDQAGLGSGARSANLAGAMTVRGGAVNGREIVLIDDVLTTGSTLSEATRVIDGAGGRVVAAAVVAVTPRKEGPPCRKRSSSASVGL